jgi:hypothetical protein
VWRRDSAAHGTHQDRTRLQKTYEIRGECHSKAGKFSIARVAVADLFPVKNP